MDVTRKHRSSPFRDIILVVGVFVFGACRDRLLPTPVIGNDSPVASASLAFSTYLGGWKEDSIRDVTTDSRGNLYVTGGTTSPDFPVTKGAYQTRHNPGSPDSSRIDMCDVFVAKLSPSGTVLWSTFIGGPNYDRAYAIRVDELGYVYVAGRAGRGFPVTTGAFQTTFMGGQEAPVYGPQDGFLLKLRPDGAGLVWASYFGTSDPQIIRDLDVDSKGDVYIASGYSGGLYPEALRTAFNNAPHGDHDGVAAKIGSDGSKLLWATYLGGSAWESNENSIRLDGSDNPYVLLTTKSDDCFVSASAYRRTHGGDDDLYVTRLGPHDGTIAWATYLGGSKGESTETHQFAVDPDGNAYIAAPTRSTDFPTTAGAFQTSYGGGGNEAVVVKLSSDGSKLLAGTFIGGNGNDRPEGVAVDRAGNVYFTGTTTSIDFPVTANARQKTLNGERDAIAVRLSADFSRLIYATYLGGAGVEYGRAATVDAQGKLCLGGETNSTDWPTRNAFQVGFGGGNGDAVVAKLD